MTNIFQNLETEKNEYLPFSQGNCGHTWYLTLKKQVSHNLSNIEGISFFGLNQGMPKR